MNIVTRPITDAELGAFYDAANRGMGVDPTEGDEHLEHFRAIVPLDGTIAAFDGDEIVGTFATYFLDLTVPGGEVPMAGTTVVSVRPTHRRRGILTSMMHTHLSDMRDRGQVVAGLWASEYGIYNRFGYGPASDTTRLKLDRRLVSFPDGPENIKMRLVDRDEAARLLPAIYDVVRQSVPGMFKRTETWWEHRTLVDPEHRRGGASSLRYVIAELDGVPVGYASYRQKSNWDGWKPENEVMVADHFTIDARARRALWSYLSHIDLHPHITVGAASVDHPMLWEVDQPRYVQRVISDALWIRILDLVGALESRSYLAEGQVVFQINDQQFTEISGRYLLEVADGKGLVSPTDRDPQVSLGVSDLGAIYLGGRSLRTLVDAGRASGSPEAIDLMDAMFRSAVTPFCQEIF